MKGQMFIKFVILIPNSFCTVHDYGRGGTASCRHVTDFLSLRISNNLRLPWKTELLWNFSLYWNIFYLSGFLSNLRLHWKTEFALIFFTVLDILFTCRIF